MIRGPAIDYRRIPVEAARALTAAGLSSRTLDLDGLAFEIVGEDVWITDGSDGVLAAFPVARLAHFSQNALDCQIHRAAQMLSTDARDQVLAALHNGHDFAADAPPDEDVVYVTICGHVLRIHRGALVPGWPL